MSLTDLYLRAKAKLRATDLWLHQAGADTGTLPPISDSGTVTISLVPSGVETLADQGNVTVVLGAGLEPPAEVLIHWPISLDGRWELDTESHWSLAADSHWPPDLDEHWLLALVESWQVQTGTHWAPTTEGKWPDDSETHWQPAISGHWIPDTDESW